jgi:hypothetical protein
VTAAVLMGLLGYFVSNRSIFFMSVFHLGQALFDTILDLIFATHRCFQCFSV